MSFLLILIKFFLNRNVVDVLFQQLSLEKQKHYLLLVWATQSMFHLVANRNSVPRAVSGRPAWGWWHVWGEAWPPGCGGGPVSPCPQQPPSIIVADTGPHDPGVGMLGAGSLLPCWTKVGNSEFYFCVILFTWNLHYTRCECTLYLFVVQGPVAEREGREVQRFCLVSLTNMGGVGMMTGCWAHLHTQWCKISSPFHQEPRSYSNK